MYEKLKEVARKRGLIFYSDLATSLGMSFENEVERNVLKNDLGDISIFEHSQGRPMLLAVVVHKPTSSEPRMQVRDFLNWPSTWDLERFGFLGKVLWC